MKSDLFSFAFAGLAALTVGWLLSRQGCPACVLLPPPQPPAAFDQAPLHTNP